MSQEIKALRVPGSKTDTGITWGSFSWNYTTDERLGRSDESHSEILSVGEWGVALAVLTTEAVVVELYQK